MKMREFYADPDRAGSGEFDLGSSWRTQGQGPWKVVWLEATGEIAAFDQSGDEVVVVGFVEDVDELSALLTGWEEHAGEPNGLAWLVERCDNQPDSGDEVEDG
jgi:hypothetical protein